MIGHAVLEAPDAGRELYSVLSTQHVTAGQQDAVLGRVHQRVMLHIGDSVSAAVERGCSITDAGLEAPAASQQCTHGSARSMSWACHVTAGRQDAVLGKVQQRLRFMCEARREPIPYIGDVVSAAARLGAKRLALCDPASLRLRMQ